MPIDLAFPLPARPRLRHLTLQLVEIDGEPVIAVHDPQGYTEPFGLSPHLAAFLQCCDGRTTIADMRRIVGAEAGLDLGTEDIERIITALDELLLLDSPRFAVHRERLDRDFIESPVRPAAHAGTSYPADPRMLRERLDDILALARSTGGHNGKLVGLIAPHIDLRVGENAYAPAYGTLRAAIARRPADDPRMTFVILGTSHYGGNGLFVATRKAYETPLGNLTCDEDFLDRLETHFGDSLTADDTAHRQEHSIEFQTIFLRHLFDGEDGNIRIAPILCTSFHGLFDPVERETVESEYRRFVAALRRTIAEHPTPVCLLVGGDLAHVGRKFGDPFDAATVLEKVGAEDRALLDAVAQGDAAGLLAHIARDRDARNVCGFPPMLAFLDALEPFGPTRGEVLHYEQWDERETSSAVTYASLAFYGE